MTFISNEIADVQAAAARRLARLREKQRRERARHDARVLALLRARVRPEALAAVEAEAQEQLMAERALRSERARAARTRAAATQSGGAHCNEEVDD